MTWEFSHRLGWSKASPDPLESWAPDVVNLEDYLGNVGYRYAIQLGDDLPHLEAWVSDSGRWLVRVSIGDVVEIITAAEFPDFVELLNKLGPLVIANQLEHAAETEARTPYFPDQL